MSQIRRRQFLTAAGALLAAPYVPARARTNVRSLGMLIPSNAPTHQANSKLWYPLLLKRLNELGWVEGKTLRIEYAFSGDDLSRLPELAATLVAKKVDVIWAGGPPSAVAAARTTSTIPIVFWRVGFPVQYGLVDSLARPGRNVTGLAWFADATIYVKRYDILREIAPNAEHVATIVVPSSGRTVSGGKLDLRGLFDTVNAETHRLRLVRKYFAVKQLAGFKKAFTAIEKWGADSLNVLDVPTTILARRQIIDFARHDRLVDVYETREWVEAGGLASYGIVFEPTLLRTAEMVDQILRGAKPSDIPVELPSRYELVLNQAVAKAQDVTFPQSILARADQVIE